MEAIEKLKWHRNSGLVMNAIEKLSMLAQNEDMHNDEYKVELHDENIVAVKIKREVWTIKWMKSLLSVHYLLLL